MSLNTFAFALFTIVLAKINDYNHYPLTVYLFYLSFATMQLLEGLVWLTLNRTRWNVALSVATLTLILLQPVASLMTIEKRKDLRSKLLVAYGAFVVVLLAWALLTISMDFRMVPAPNGHLEWKWLTQILETPVGLSLFAVWFLFFILPSALNGSIIAFACIAFTCAASLFTFYQARTFGSLWCWVSNVVFVAIMLDMLFLQPCMKPYMNPSMKPYMKSMIP